MIGHRRRRGPWSARPRTTSVRSVNRRRATCIPARSTPCFGDAPGRRRRCRPGTALGAGRCWTGRSAHGDGLPRERGVARDRAAGHERARCSRRRRATSMAVSQRPLPAGRSEAAGSTSQRCAVELAGSRWRWRWRVAPAGGTWSRRSPPPGSKHTWRSRPSRRRRGGRKRHAKTDRSERPHVAGVVAVAASCPSRGSRRRMCWSRVERVRLYTSLVDQRRVWIQRVHAELFQHGVAVPEAQIRSTGHPRPVVERRCRL